jgi:sulfur-oxidizing protein SoxY
MGMTRRLLAAAVLAAAVLGAGWGSARAEESQAAREARWHEIAATIWKAPALLDGRQVIQLDTPARALDAALVPVEIRFPGPKPTALWLVIDDNPVPLVGVFRFGPAADPSVIRTRVRVDQYTLVHAVAQMPDGKLYEVANFMKAAGGCSAPAGTDQQEAMARLGRMKLRVDPAPPGQSAQAQLLISHPNNNGMQMDPVTRLYVPARYVTDVTVREGDALVFTLQSEISFSENPAIGFAFVPKAGAPLHVEVRDSSKAVFTHDFPLDARAS